MNKKRLPQYLLSLHGYVLFSKSGMSFDLKNPRWPPLAWISKIGHIFATEADIGMLFIKNDIYTDIFPSTFRKNFYYWTFCTDVFANVFYCAFSHIV